MRFTLHPTAIVLLILLPITSAIAETETKQTFNIPAIAVFGIIAVF